MHFGLRGLRVPKVLGVLRILGVRQMASPITGPVVCILEIVVLFANLRVNSLSQSKSEGP